MRYQSTLRPATSVSIRPGMSGTDAASMPGWSLPSSCALPIGRRDFESPKYQSFTANVFWKTVGLS